MPKAMEPIGPPGPTLADVAYQRIADALLAGKIAPGARMVMDQLADELGISRTPVRDALFRLEREGMIESTGKRGYVVRDVDAVDISQFYEVRVAVEGFAARRVAEIGETAIGSVRSAIEESAGVDVSDLRAVYDANLRIHRKVVEVVGNPALVELFDQVWQRARGLATFADYFEHERFKVSVQSAHLPLIDAFRAGPDQAFTAMREHINAGHQIHLERNAG